MPRAALDLLVGLVFVGLGVLLLPSRGRRPVGVLMMAVGGAWLLGSTFAAAVFLYRGPLIHLLLSYPTGRARRPELKVVILLGYLDMVQVVGRSHGVTIALGTLVTAVTAAEYRRAGGAERRGRLTAAISSAALMGILLIGAVARLAGVDVDPELLVVFDCALLVAATVLFADLRWGRWNRSAITSLVVDLGRSEDARTVRDKLARVLNDPGLELGFVDQARDVLVDENGRPVVLTAAGDDRERTILRRDGQAIAELAHTPGALDDPVLRESVTALTGMAVANARLQAVVLARVAEVEASRRRILEAADRERQALEAEMRSGPEARLEKAELLLDSADAEVIDLLNGSRSSLRDFARGVHPRSLASTGLAGACAELAQTAPLPVTLDVAAERLSPEVELALYFVCAEALTNTVKYAEATSAEVRLMTSDGAVRLEVSDNGRGGASIGAAVETSGTGLRGLADRLAVIGGTLTVDSPAGSGTTVIAQVPRAAITR